MFLKQVAKTIKFGTDERWHGLSTERFGHFTAEDVTEARNDLMARYPDETDTIDRYAARLMVMLD